VLVRERTEQIEDSYLSPFASRVTATRGREIYDEPCPMRTEYARDRDRIIHCKSFRRLKYKTQVFLAPEGDHYRTRLTHTLEVSQIARTISKALRLNEDLTEAIALGHDLGHTPFGHAGERALNEVSQTGFHHYTQSLRVVDRIERDGRGLNLTWEVRNGILCHTTGEEAATLEGRVVKLADRIAYINHDIDDAIRAGVLNNDDIPEKEIIGTTHSGRINTLISDVVAQSAGQPELKMSPEIKAAFDRLHQFMFDSVYTNPTAKSEEVKAVYIVKQLYRYFMEHTDRLHEEFRAICAADGANAAVCDYIAGMTDRFAVQAYEDIFIPRPWKA
jgi:dGTPase